MCALSLYRISRLGKAGKIVQIRYNQKGGVASLDVKYLSSGEVETRLSLQNVTPYISKALEKFNQETTEKDNKPDALRLTRQALKFVERRQARRNMSPRSSRRRRNRINHRTATSPPTTQETTKTDTDTPNTPPQPHASRVRRHEITPDAIRNYEAARLEDTPAFLRSYEADKILLDNGLTVFDNSSQESTVDTVALLEELTLDGAAEVIDDGHDLITPMRTPEKKGDCSDWSAETSPSPITKPRRLEFSASHEEDPDSPPRLVDGSVHYYSDSGSPAVEIMARATVPNSVSTPNPSTPPRLSARGQDCLETLSAVSTPRKNNTSVTIDDSATPDTFKMDNTGENDHTDHDNTDTDSYTQNDSLESCSTYSQPTDEHTCTTDGGSLEDPSSINSLDNPAGLNKNLLDIIGNKNDTIKTFTKTKDKSVSFFNAWSLDESVSDGGLDLSNSYDYFTEESYTDDDDRSACSEVIPRKKERPMRGAGKTAYSTCFTAASDSMLPDFRLVSKILSSAGGALFSAPPSASPSASTAAKAKRRARNNRRPVPVRRFEV